MRGGTTSAGAVALPKGFRVRLRPELQLSADRRVIVGGSPLRVLRLRPQAADVIHGDEAVIEDDTSRAVVSRLLVADLAVPALDEAPSDSDDLTVVIPTHDRADSLEQALSLLRPQLPCVVVDDASTDPAAIAAVCHRWGASLVPLEQNVGPGAARNAGLKHVTTRLVAFVDSDVRVAATDLRNLGKHFVDPLLVAVAPRVVGRPASASPGWFERYDQEHGSLDLGATSSLVREGAVVSYLPAACLVAVLDRLGEGFDPRLRVAEDVDLVWRLDRAGWRVRYAPEVVAEHITRSSIHGWLGRLFLYGTGGALLAERHGGRIAPAVFHPAYLTAALALTAQRWWSVPVAATAVGYTTLWVRRRLESVPNRNATALHLALAGFRWTVRQEGALLLRHWWPLAAAAAIASPRVRRAMIVALIIDLTNRGADRHVSWPEYVVARRLDDLAYGAGLWAGALRSKSVRALVPRLVTGRSRRRHKHR
jgi:mycofactocin glycosyltransferase